MDEEYSESIDTSNDIDASDADVADAVPDDIPEDSYSETDVIDDVSEDVIEETVEDNADYDEDYNPIEEDSIDVNFSESDEPADDIEDDAFDEEEDISESYEVPDDISEDTEGFDDELIDKSDVAAEIPEDVDDSELYEQDEVYEEDIPEDVTETESVDDVSADAEDTNNEEQSEDGIDSDATEDSLEADGTDTTAQPEDVFDTEVTDETFDAEDSNTSEQEENMTDAETTDETSNAEDADVSEQPQDISDVETANETVDAEDTTAEQPEDMTDAEHVDESSDENNAVPVEQTEAVTDTELADENAVADRSNLEAYDYETAPETLDSVNTEKSGEYVSAENPYRERWEGLAEESSADKEESWDWDSLKDVPFAGDNDSEIPGSSDSTSHAESSETPEINSISEYMNAHNYGPDDFATYSQDPQWRQLMRQEYPDYELPELSQESANAQLSQYMNDHNYGVDDYAEYSQDPIWRDLHTAAFPDDDMPPLNKADNLGDWRDIPSDITAKENIDAANPNYELGEEWQVNCQRCVPTYEMRSRGYDVTAQPCVDDNDYLAYNPFDVWEHPDVMSTSGNGLSDIQRKMSEWGEGSRAQVVVLWENGDGGHTFTAEQKNGNTIFVDPQNGDMDVGWYFDEAKQGRTQFCRIDNLQPGQHILNCCEQRRKA